MFEQRNAELRSRSRLFARVLFWQPEEVNAHIAPDSLNDQQCIRGQNKCDSPRSVGLGMDVIRASGQQMMVKSEHEGCEHGSGKENESKLFLRGPDENHCDERKEQHNEYDEGGCNGSKADAQFTVGRTMDNVNQEMKKDNTSCVCDCSAHALTLE